MQRRSKTVGLTPDGARLDRERVWQMEVVVAMADADGFTAAARRLHVVQSAVSGTIRAAERELGTPSSTGPRTALPSPRPERRSSPPPAQHSGPPHWHEKLSMPYRGSCASG
ncbi:helix-turn-helix domain-containing protein [Streptomyces mirabilis]|jgi:hypothetical protein|uniref:helix-turn-helix domain-containing protein n=1 Tax=Streptomyces mirabilis TaxID=68239 RepID=UPI00210EA2F4|nr:LysR family transcriptional regulator [Streptomyces mirabilis]